MQSEYIIYRKLEDIAESLSISDEQKTILDKINQKVAGGQTLDEIMNFLFDNPASPSDRLGLSFLEDSNTRVTAYWARSKNEKIFLKKGFWQALAGSTLQRIIENDELRIINDLQKYALEHPESLSTKLILKEGVKSSITCPLKVNGRSIGFLFISSYNKFAYRKEHILMHSLLAERISQSVEKAYQIEQLSEQNRAYMEMLAFVSHEIKNPLSSIIMDADLLLKGYLGELKPEQSKKILKLQNKSKFLLELTKDYLNLARIETGKLEPHITKNVDIINIISETLNILDTQAKSKKININCDFRIEKLILDCDKELIKIVFLNIIGNAIKYAYDESQINIKAYEEHEQIVVNVRNAGPGFSEEDKERLFKKFSRIKRDELMKQKGTGLGLYTVWQIINAHNGKIIANSELNKWAEFTVFFPHRQII